MDPTNQTDPAQSYTPQPQTVPQPVISGQPQQQVSPGFQTQPVVVGQPQPQSASQSQPFVSQPQSGSVLPAATTAQYPIQSANSSKHGQKKGLIIGIIGGVVVIILALLILIALPAIQRQAMASSFMDDVTAGKLDSAVTRTGDPTSKPYLTNAVAKLKGEKATFKTSKYNPKAESYYLYNLSGGDYKSARVSVSKDKGKLVVMSFVYDTQQLKLVPSSSSTTTNTTDSSAAAEQTTPTSPVPTPTPSTAGKCLVAADFTALSSYPVDPDSNGAYVWTDSVFFNADVATYAYPDIMSDFYAKYKTFYTQQAAKDFTVQLTGEVNSTSSDTALANARVAKVQTDMENLAGVPASRITVNSPTNYGSSLGSGDSGSQNRNVDIKIASSASCVK